MDVRLRKSIAFYFLFWILCLSGCADRFDTRTASGRNALIYDANAHLSRGECQLAFDEISRLYGTQYQTEQVQLVMASAYACFAGYNMLTIAATLTGSSSFFGVLAKTMPSKLGDQHISNMYSATDVLTGQGSQLSASARTTSVNNYMVFIQAGVIGAILSTYGNPTSNGTKTTALTYHLPPVGADLSTLDACALTAAFSIMADSFDHSSFSDATTSSLVSSLSSACVTAGFASCTALNQNRALCTGGAADVPSQDALAVVTAVNGAW